MDSTRPTAHRGRFANQRGLATPPRQLNVHNLDSIQHIDVCVVPGYHIPMKTTIDTIIAEVLSLSPQARAFVAEKLIESLDSEPEVVLSSAWREEVRKRCREVDEGSVELRDAEDVFARGYAALG